MAPLPELSAISKTLNDESNRVNALLLEFERKLCALNLGLEAWVTDQALTDRRLIETYEKYTGDQEGELYRSYDQQLGFGQIGDRWALVVRTVTFERPSVSSDRIVLSNRRRKREGWRTDETAYRVDWSGDCVVRPEGLEPPTPRSVVSPRESVTDGEGV